MEINTEFGMGLKWGEKTSRISKMSMEVLKGSEAKQLLVCGQLLKNNPE